MKFGYLMWVLNLVLGLLVFLGGGAAYAASESGAGDITVSLQASDVPEAKQTHAGLYLAPREVFDIMQKQSEKVLFLDVRTPAELEYVGWTALVDQNIPLMLDDPSAWDEKKHAFQKRMNPDFVRQVENALDAKKLDSNTPIILMCRSGQRSAKAADMLKQYGFSRVYSMVEGFEGDKAKEGDSKGRRTVNGWKNAGLPWSYHLEKSKLYLTTRQ